jgi:hypothetical protein
LRRERDKTTSKNRTELLEVNARPPEMMFDFGTATGSGTRIVGGYVFILEERTSISIKPWRNS